MKANNNKTSKNLWSWDSEGLKLDNFWIFTEISKCEQLYLLFTSIKISVFMLVWKSSGYSLRKYIVLRTHIIYSYWMLFLLKNWEKHKKLFFHFILFSAPPYFTKARLMSFHIVFKHVPCFHVSCFQTLDEAHSGVMRT